MMLKYLIVLIGFISCANQNDSKLYLNWEDPFIEELGTYTINNDTLKVYVENSIIKFELKNQSNQILLKSTTQPSIYHRWFLYFDDDNNLWFYSGDIGIDLYIKLEKSYEYRAVDFFNDVEMNNLPTEFKIKLENG